MTHRPDPTRRNRNIGTPKQGHGQSNKDRIPRTWAESRCEWKRDVPQRLVHRLVWGREFPILVEHTRADSVHGCTPDDVAVLLNALPKRHVNGYRGIAGIQGVVLRQATRREEKLQSVWGRLVYCVDIGSDWGPVIYLEAQSLPVRQRWGKGVGPEDALEVERMTQAASTAERTKRGLQLEFDLEAVRRVQLYQTLPHEIGHWSDMCENVQLPSDQELGDYEELWDAYWQRPHLEREQFAHRFAERVVAPLIASGAVPFERKLDVTTLTSEGLRPEDFAPV